MKTISRGALLAAAALTSFGAASLVLERDALAQGANVVAVEGAGFNASGSLQDNLKSHVGKDVFVHLRSGQTLHGTIKTVGTHLLHLEKLVGKEFYDALVRIEDVAAFEVRFRKYQEKR